MKIRWDQVPLGAVSGAVTFTVTDEMIDQHLAAAEMSPDWLPDAEDAEMRRGPGRIAPIDMITRLFGKDLMYGFHNSTIGQSVRAKQAATFYAPARVGMEIRATGRIVRKYEKRKRKFVVYEMDFVDGTGQLLIRDERVLMVLDADFKAKPVKEAAS
jgi:hypothetical protein